MNSTAKVILGITAGVMAGAVTGLLLAPDDGRKTRKKITKETDKLRNSISEAVRESLDSAKTRYNHLLDEYANETKKGISEAKNAVNEAKNTVKAN